MPRPQLPTPVSPKYRPDNVPMPVVLLDERRPQRLVGRDDELAHFRARRTAARTDTTAGPLFIVGARGTGLETLADHLKDLGRTPIDDARNAPHGIAVRGDDLARVLHKAEAEVTHRYGSIFTGVRDQAEVIAEQLGTPVDSMRLVGETARRAGTVVTVIIEASTPDAVLASMSAERAARAAGDPILFVIATRMDLASLWRTHHEPGDPAPDVLTLLPATREEMLARIDQHVGVRLDRGPRAATLSPAVRDALHNVLVAVEAAQRIDFRTLIECYKQANLRYPDQQFRDRICNAINEAGRMTPAALSAFFDATLAANDRTPPKISGPVRTALADLAKRGYLTPDALRATLEQAAGSAQADRPAIVDDAALAAIQEATGGFGDALAKVTNAAWAMAEARGALVPGARPQGAALLTAADVEAGLHMLRTRRVLPAGQIRDRQVAITHLLPDPLFRALRAVARAQADGIAEPTIADAAAAREPKSGTPVFPTDGNLLEAVTELARRGFLRARSGHCSFVHPAVAPAVLASGRATTADRNATARAAAGR